MTKLYLLIVFYISQQILGINGQIQSFAHKYDRLNCIAESVLQNTNDSYLTIIFTPDHTSNSSEISYLLQYIIRKNPSFVTVHSKVKIIPSLYRAKSIATYIFFFEAITNNKRQLRYNLRYLIRSISSFKNKSPRPRCLLILFHYDIDSIDFEYLQNLGSDNKFLDFALIEISMNKSNPVLKLRYYNEFRKQYVVLQLLPHSNLFENKLKNAMGYQLYVDVGKNVKQNNNGYLTGLSGEEIFIMPLISEVFKKLNFTLSVISSKSGILDSIKANVGYYITSYFTNYYTPNMMLARTFVSEIANQKPISPLLNSFSECEKLVALVPVIENKKLYYSDQLFVYAGTIVVIMCAIKCINKCFFNKDKFWSFFYVFQMLMGIPTSLSANNSTKKIFFVCFAFIALKFSADFYSNIINIKYVNEMQIPFDTFKQISKSDYDIFISFFLYDHIKSEMSKLKNDSQYVAVIINKSKKMYDTAQCLQKIRKKYDVMCITTFNEIEHESMSGIRTLKPLFGCVKWFYQIEEGSVFVNKVQEMLLRLLESGTAQYFKPPKKIIDYSLAESEEEIFVSTMTLITIVLTVGYCTSIIVLLIELMISFNNLRSNRVSEFTARI